MFSVANPHQAERLCYLQDSNIWSRSAIAQFLLRPRFYGRVATVCLDKTRPEICSPSIRMTACTAPMANPATSMWQVHSIQM